MQNEGTPIRVQGKHLRCVHCGSVRFVRRQAQLDTALMALFGVETMADVFLCTTCGRLEWFLDPTVSPEPPEVDEVDDDRTEPTECMACGQTIPAGQDQCPKCGWTYKQDETIRRSESRPRMNIEIVETPVNEVIASGLIAELDAELQQRYPGAAINGIDAAQFQAADGYFVVARVASDCAGCGAFRSRSASAVEIKRVFVRPRFRRHGIARAILEALETEAKRRGYTHAVLETGVHQPEAIALYHAAGYADIEPFGPYVGRKRSVCLGKAL